jgi:hypothetical protein
MEAAAYVTAAVEATAYIATAVVPTRCATCEAMSTTGIAGSAVVIAGASAGVANSTTVTNSTPAVAVARSTVVATAAIVAAAAVISTATPIPVIPGAGSDEEATDKPARSIVSIGRARVGVVVVISPRTHRRRVPVTVISVSTAVANANPDTNTYLGTRRSRHERCRNDQRAEQQEISENLHFGPPRQGIMHCVTNRFGDTSTTLVNFGCYYLKQHFLLKVALF